MQVNWNRNGQLGNVIKNMKFKENSSLELIKTKAKI